MLTPRYDLDRAFDVTLKRSLPYLIFSSQDFRDKLAEQLDTLCQYYQENNDASFPDRNLAINKMLDEAPEMDELTELKIHYLESHQKRIDELFWDINSRLSKLEKKTDKRSPDTIDNSVLPAKEVSTDESGISVQQSLVKETPIKPLKPKEIVLAFLKSSQGSYSFRDISSKTGLTKEQVSNVLQRVKRAKGPIKWETRKIQTSNGKGKTHLSNVIFYSWAGEEQDKDSHSK